MAGSVNKVILIGNLGLTVNDLTLQGGGQQSGQDNSQNDYGGSSGGLGADIPF